MKKKKHQRPINSPSVHMDARPPSAIPFTKEK
jgi:hypothetical protein